MFPMFTMRSQLVYCLLCRIIPAWFCDSEGHPTFRALGSLTDSWLAWNSALEAAGAKKQTDSLASNLACPSATKSFQIVQYQRPNAAVDFVNTGIGLGRLALDAPNNQLRVSLLPVILLALGKLYLDDYPTLGTMLSRLQTVLSFLRELVEHLKETTNEEKPAPERYPLEEAEADGEEESEDLDDVEESFVERYLSYEQRLVSSQNSYMYVQQVV